LNKTCHCHTRNNEKRQKDREKRQGETNITAKVVSAWTSTDIGAT